MPLNNSKGNMFDFVTHTWNPIKGACFYDCSYCYMKRWGEGRLKAPRLVKSELKTDLGNNNFIFVGSSIDMFAVDIPHSWISDVLFECNNCKNKYLLQTKNPVRYHHFLEEYYFRAEKFVLSTTIESNRGYEAKKNYVPPQDRAFWMCKLPKEYKRMLTIEPIMDFDADQFIEIINAVNPQQINIGADTMNKNLKEPSADKLRFLIASLECSGFKIKQKSNLKRILKGDEKK